MVAHEYIQINILSLFRYPDNENTKHHNGWVNIRQNYYYSWIQVTFMLIHVLIICHVFGIHFFYRKCDFLWHFLLIIKNFEALYCLDSLPMLCRKKTISMALALWLPSNFFCSINIVVLFPNVCLTFSFGWFFPLFFGKSAVFNIVPRPWACLTWKRQRSLIDKSV